MRWSTLSLCGVIIAAVAVGVMLGVRKFPQLSNNIVSSVRTADPHDLARTADDVQTAEAGDCSAQSWHNRWRASTDRVSTPARDREMAGLIEELARTDPQQALALAKAETNWRLRDLLRNAALRGWASVNSAAAGDFALTIHAEQRRSAVEAVLQGVAANPAEAVKTALHLCQSDPEPAGDYGHYTIAALVDAGAFKEAVEFGNQIGTEKFPFLLKSAFFQWSRNQPAEAMAAAGAINDPVVRAQAYGEAISGWAWSDAKAVAEYALQLPAGHARNEAFTEALPRWVEKDPVAATEWINRMDSGPEFDSGIEAVANMQSLIQGQPSTAMNLAGNISDAVLRSHTLRAVFRQWAASDPNGARAYMEQSAGPTDRTLLADELLDLSPE